MKAICAFFLLFSSALYGQEYRYAHYDMSQGLPSLNVFFIYQDRDGFMWFATEAGLCRYDGTRFQTFTVADGLPDNEIMGISQDREGRIWLLPFKKSVCYYEQGTFHTPENTPFLKTIRMQDRLHSAAQDLEGNVWLAEGNFLYRISPTHQVTTFSEIGGVPIEGCTRMSSCPEGGISFIMKSGYYQYRKQVLRCLEKTTEWHPSNQTPFRQISLSSQAYVSAFFTKDRLKAVSKKYSSTFHFSINRPMLGFSLIRDSIFFACTNQGAFQYSFLQPHQKPLVFLPNKNIGCVFEDQEDNLWFSVMGDGLYRLISPHVQSFHPEKYTGVPSQVSFLGKYKNDFLIGTSASRFLTTPDFQKIQAYKVKKYLFPFPYRILFIKPGDKNDWLIHVDNWIEKGAPGLEPANRLWVYPKSVYDLPGSKLLIASHRNVIRVDENDFSKVDTLWHERATVVFQQGKTIYIGTLNGLYCLSENGKTEFLGHTHPLLRCRIASIQATADGALWVGTCGNGLLRLEKNRVTLHLSEKEGLSNNICHTIASRGNDVWVGTFNGLNRVRARGKTVDIAQYTTSDGLVSNNIEHLLLSGDTVCIGTAQGVSFFDETKIKQKSTCNLHPTRVLINEQAVPLQKTYVITSNEKNFSVEFVALSFKSEGRMQYRYRLNGVYKDWHPAPQRSIQLTSLPYGDYTLEIVATNAYGVVSKPIQIHLVVPMPFYKSVVFFALLSALLTGLGIWITYWRLKKIRIRERERESLENKIIQLELMALRAQMDPHFIFNCLTSLQHAIYEKEVKQANRLLTRFASLIRQTLDQASQLYMPLADEISYLSNYMEVEQMRFNNNFDFSITMDPDVPIRHITVPNMILQPLLENSIRHGIQHKTDGKGKVCLHFSYQSEQLCCQVTDNGVGRKKAAEYKNHRFMTHQSKSTNINSRRILLLKSVLSTNIDMTTEDLLDEMGMPCGTKVYVTIPDPITIQAYRQPLV